MTATERLRELLDERGVEHADIGGMTEWANENRRICRAYTRPEPLTVDIAMLAVPPEQAIEATLGRGTCKLDGYTDAAFSVCQSPNETDFTDYAEVCECTACGASIIVSPSYTRVSHDRGELWPAYNFCPSCGRKVVDD